MSTSVSLSGDTVDTFVSLLYTQCKKPFTNPLAGITDSQWKVHFD